MLFGVFMILGEQKIPGDIPLFIFPWRKQKTTGGISPLVFCFPRTTLKSQFTDFNKARDTLET